MLVWRHAKMRPCPADGSASRRRWRAGLALLLLPFFLAACESDDGPYLKISGGGFVFNYRVAEARLGLVAEALRPLPDGAVLVARLEDPAGGEPIVLDRRVGPATSKFVFDSPPLHGVEADRPYRLTLELSAGGEVLQTLERDFSSNVSQAALPEKPLTVGPGYARNPESR